MTARLAEYPAPENRMSERELIAAYGGLQPAPREAVSERSDATEAAGAGDGELPAAAPDPAEAPIDD